MEFGIQPVGQQICPELFPDSSSFLRCLEDLLIALQWVHNYGMANRNVRGDNFIVFVQNHEAVGQGATGQRGTNRHWWGILIDFDRAATLSKECHYEGGYICCPCELLRRSSSSSGYHDAEGTSSGSTEGPLGNAGYIIYDSE